MRLRVWRELGTVVGVAVVLAGLVFANQQWKRGGLIEQYTRIREAAEEQQVAQGIELLDWELLRQTTGGMRDVPDFADALEARDGQQVNVVGFMSPIDQFRDAEHFMLLPLPIECFFCNAPPRHYVVLVEMAEGTRAQMVNEPVFISGTLELAQTEAPKFFYRIDNASMRGADEGGGLTPMNTPMEHRMDLMQNIQELQGPMLEGTDAGPADGAAPGSGS